jgi:hypothetical protein
MAREAATIDANRATRLAFASAPGPSLAKGPRVFWVCAECLPLVTSVYSPFTLDPPVTAPADKAHKVWQREAAITDLVRGRLQGLGPVTARELADSLALATSEIGVALVELESEDVKRALLQIVAILNEEQVELMSLETEEPNLEHVFLHLTGRALRD